MLALSFGPSLVIDLEGKEVLPPTRDGYTPYTTWSPRGVYATYTGNGLWLRNVATNRARRLTPFVNSRPSWAPDGRVIAGGTGRRVALTRVKDGKVFVRFPRSNIDGGVPVVVARGGGSLCVRRERLRDRYHPRGSAPSAGGWARAC